MVKLVKHDLEFILKQINIAEQHANGTPLSELVDSPLLPYGLRTVDGSYNNFGIGREQWGSSGQPFPPLSTGSPHQGSGSLPPGYPTNNDYGQPGSVVDVEPRLISNLIVDQTLDNPAAITAALQHAGLSGAALTQALAEIRGAHTILKAVPEGSPAHDLAKAQLDALLDQHDVRMDGPTVLLPNVAPDEGISASYNSFFTLFGQFFDHGLDLVKKGGNGTVYIPLSPDDPLYNPASPHTNFMAMTRVSTGDEAGNVTTPWVDQNQTYTSHPSHQVFLREYAVSGGVPLATGELLEGEHGLATWGDVKAQAAELLGIRLTDQDVGSVPVVAVDPYGEFIRGPNGLPQIVAALRPDGTPILVEGDLANPLAPSAIQLPPGTQIMGSGGTTVTIVDGQTVSALRTGTAFLDDIAHNAVPVAVNGVLQADADDAVGYSGGVDARGRNTSYDDETLDAHYVTGDGRGNENIGLSAVHHIFHAEHNRVVDHVKDVVLASGDLAFLNEWLLGPDLTAWPSADQLASLAWDGERVFQAARFTTEMQYQHLVFEEFARKIQPDVDVFMVQPDVELNPAIFAEFANVIYRFGHSMLNQTVDRINADGTRDDIDLFDAFLNPLEFGGAGVDHHEAAGAILRGMTAQVGQEIDEFVTDVLRNQLTGIPLDLAAINIARGRDTGMPTLNEARAQFMAMASGDTQLKPYESWTDFALNLKTPASIVNFIAAYGTHDLIAGEASIDGKRAAAMVLVFGTAETFFDPIANQTRTIGPLDSADRLDFLNARGAYADRRGGLDDVDLWVGGLAEKKMAFGGMLGSTFSFVFELQMENLQDADRFYYLSRTQGLNLLTELENNSLAKMVLRNTDLGETGTAIPADIFSTPDLILYVDHAKQLAMTGRDDPEHEDPTLEAISAMVERRDLDGDGTLDYIRYNGDAHIVIQGTQGNDKIVAGDGDDAVWGDDGDDTIEAGYGIDHVSGGEGDDIITNAGTDIGMTDMLKGDGGNDVIHGGSGMAMLFGGSGKDFLIAGPDGSNLQGGTEDDFLLGGDGSDMIFGGAGNDWVESDGRFDYIAGDTGDIFFNSTIIGHDIINGGRGDTDYDADSGDDIMVAGEGIQKNIGMWGHDWVIHKGQETGADADMNVQVFTTLPLEVLRDRFSQVEALSGWRHDDTLRGDDRTSEDEETGAVADPTPEGNFIHNELDQAGIDRIAGLDQIITPGMMREVNYWADGSGAQKMAFVGGNILLGGGGGDVIEGRAGDDVIDGDAWLNVRISIRANPDGTGDEIATVDSMKGNVTLTIDGAPVTRPLTAWMLTGHINPGQLQAVREILHDDSGTDVAVYWDVRDNYVVTRNDDGSLRVEHVTVSDVVDPVTGRQRLSDGTDTLRNIEVLRFADQEVTLSPPTLALNAYDSGGNYADSFGSSGYGNSNGSHFWGPDWTESGDGGGAPATGGQIRITGGALLVGQGDGATITRAVDLSAATSARLSFTANPDNLDAGEQVAVWFSRDGMTFEQIGTITGNGPAATMAFDLSGPFTTTAAIRFVASSINAGNEFVSIDNLSIDLVVPAANPTTDHAASFTENGAATDIASLPGIEEDSGVLASARIVLTNAQPLDDLLVGALPGTIAATVDRSVAGRITVTLTGAGTVEEYQRAIQAVSFRNTSDNPDTQPRMIEVTVNDGMMDSNVARTTVTVTAVNDPPAASNDSVFTNVAANTPFLIPEWALLANDSDPEGPVSITGGIVTQSGLTAVRSSGSVSVTDNATAGGSFTYRVSDGGLTDTAQVTVNRTTSNTLNGDGGNNIVIGNGSANTIDAGTGDDIILAGGGNDTIRWFANNFGVTDGRDFVDGGDGQDDRFDVNGNNTAESFVVYSRVAAVAMGIAVLNPATEIVITRNGTVIAELDNVEEITINTGFGNDSVTTVGDFNPTSLNFNTITINGDGGDDTVDISGLQSAHRIHFRSNGGNDVLVGTLRPQDVIELAAGTEASDCTVERTEDGMTRLTGAGFSIAFSGTGLPQVRTANGQILDLDAPPTNDGGNEDEDEGNEGGGDDDHDDGDDDDGGSDGGGQDDDAEIGEGEEAGGRASIVGTAGADALIGTGRGEAIMGLGGRDVIFAGDGNDDVFGGDGADMLYGDGGNDRILGGDGGDFINGGTGNDTVFGGDGDDVIVAEAGDGNDVYYGDDMVGGGGRDTIDLSAITANITADLGTGLMGRGSVHSAQTGSDILWGIENIVTGSGNDVITASGAVNVMDGGAGNDSFRFLSAADADGDTILGFQPGDRIDVSAMDANGCAAGQQSFTLVSGAFTGKGQLLVTHETREDGDYTVVQGNTTGTDEADFKVSVKGSHELTAGDFVL
ncbi:peroxidase family protein [Azospirillum argentinense]